MQGLATNMVKCTPNPHTRYNVQCQNLTVVTHIIPNLTVQLLGWIVVEQTLVKTES